MEDEIMKELHDTRARIAKEHGGDLSLFRINVSVSDQHKCH